MTESLNLSDFSAQLVTKNKYKR